MITSAAATSMQRIASMPYPARVSAKRLAQALAPTAMVAITATVMAVPSPIRKVAATPAARPGELLRLRRMGMAPGRGILAVVMMMGVVAVVTVMMVPVVMMTGMIVMVVLVHRGYRGPDRGGPVERPQRRQRGAPFHPQQAQADQDDQRVADDLDDVDRASHGCRGRVQQRGRDPDHRHRDQRLQQRGGERQCHAAPPGLLVGDKVGRDHRLAVAWTGGMEDAVEERQSEQAPGGAAVGLGGANEAGELAVELRLLGEDEAEHAADRRRRRRRRTGAAERPGLRERGVEHARQEQHRRRQQREPNDRSPSDDGFYGHFTTILLAYSEPMVSAGSRWSAPSWLSFCASDASMSCGFKTETLQRPGAPTSLTGSFSAKLKSTKNSRS